IRALQTTEQNILSLRQRKVGDVDLTRTGHEDKSFARDIEGIRPLHAARENHSEDVPWANAIVPSRSSGYRRLEAGRRSAKNIQPEDREPIDARYRRHPHEP